MISDRLAFVGDVHGDLANLECIVDQLRVLPLERIIFLGDYINRGVDSARVVEFLVELARSDSRAVFLKGNHEQAFDEAIRTADLTNFLRIGGSATIRSYLGRPAQPDVFSDLVNCLPADHLAFLDSLAMRFEDDEVIAAHILKDLAIDHRYRVSAHRPIGRDPVIGPRHAMIDTGCGFPGGRLTALLWPSLRYMQAGNIGDPF